MMTKQTKQTTMTDKERTCFTKGVIIGVALTLMWVWIL